MNNEKKIKEKVKVKTEKIVEKVYNDTMDFMFANDWDVYIITYFGSEADADFISEIHIDEINSWLRERSEEWIQEIGVPL